MDFWSRLVGGAKTAKHTQSSPAHTPQQRLQRFRRAYTPVLQVCSRLQIKTANGQALEQLRVSLQRIASILREEGRTPAPHLCLSFAASAQIYSVIARAASISQNEAIIREAINVFGLLVDCEEEDFLFSPVFARSLMRFVTRATESASIGDDTEAELIEVLFGVAAKIRVQPDILPVWFSTAPRLQGTDDSTKQDQGFAGATQKNDFPLCYLLIDRIHHEGRTGDFARTGLLYIFEAVSHSPDLEDWIIRSDLPTLMASGLGALYSQLSRELSIRHENQHLPIMLALSDYVDAKPTASAETIFSRSHANHVSTFLSHLAFWQDVLEHCGSDHVKQTLLDHFQMLFLQQLLYPSLLQSSDTDGGSSVAVLTYIANILDALDHRDLVHMILHYLLAMPDPLQPKPAEEPASPMAVRRQNSLVLLNGAVSDEEKVDPNLFSLVDLILNGITSRNTQTAVAALKLSSVLLNRHTEYALATLVKASPPITFTEQRTAGALSVESEALMNIAAGLSYEECLDDAYTTALQDIVTPLEIQMVQQPSVQSSSLTLAPSDPFLVAVSSLFRSFFTNNVDVNLALTEAITNLALRTQISLDGWLAVPASSYRFGDQASVSAAVDLEYMDEDEKSAFVNLQTAHRRPQWEDSHAPLLPSLLQKLQSQIDEIRASITNIDSMLAKRIEILGGVGKDEPITRPRARTATLSRMSSNGDRDSAIANKPGEPSQIQRLRSVSAVSSRTASPVRSSVRSSTPSRVRQLATSPSRSERSSLKSPALSPSPGPGRLSRGIFQPPPPDDIDEALMGAGEISARASPNRPEYEAETLRRRLRFRKAADSTEFFHYVPDSIGKQEEDGEYEERLASTSHVLTNVVILHYFLLDLVAVLQTRAVLFDEVVFS